MNSNHVLLSALTVALVFLSAAAWAAWKRHAARDWPRVPAQVILEKRARSPLQNRKGPFKREDEVYLVEYQFGTRSFRKQLPPGASVALGGIEVWSEERQRGPHEIRVNPRAPDQFYDPFESGRWKLLAAIGGAALLIASWLHFS